MGSTTSFVLMFETRHFWKKRRLLLVESLRQRFYIVNTRGYARYLVLLTHAVFLCAVSLLWSADSFLGPKTLFVVRRLFSWSADSFSSISSLTASVPLVLIHRHHRRWPGSLLDFRHLHQHGWPGSLLDFMPASAGLGSSTRRRLKPR